MRFKKINQNILFHHFHSLNRFYESPGSLTEDSFNKFIKLNKNKIISASNLNNKQNNKFLLTFDDGLKCQYKIALPILEEHKIKSIFFFFTNHLCGEHYTIENIRFFKYQYYSNTKEYFKHFVKVCEEKFQKKIDPKNKKIRKLINFYKKQSPYYLKEEVYIKILRDNILSEGQYIKIIKRMMKDKKLSVVKLSDKLYMNEKDIYNISKLNHVIGLHSHWHSHKNYCFSKSKEKEDYKKNKYILEKIIKKKIITASYPFGNFTKNSQYILNQLDIKFAFLKNENYLNVFKKNNLFLPRKNISELIIK